MSTKSVKKSEASSPLKYLGIPDSLRFKPRDETPWMDNALGELGKRVKEISDRETLDQFASLSQALERTEAAQFNRTGLRGCGWLLTPEEIQADKIIGEMAEVDSEWARR